MKLPGEIALENAIHTGARLKKKIKELELKFSNDLDENKKVVKKIRSGKKNFTVSNQKKEGEKRSF
jgi:hypothetical protein